MQQIQMLIDGTPVGAAHGASFERRNPLSETVDTRAPAASADDALAAVSAAAHALLTKAAHELEKRGADFAAAMADETEQRVVLGHAWPDRRGTAGRRAAAGGGQLRHQRPGRCCGRGRDDDRPPCRAAHQFHRQHARRTGHRRSLRAPPRAGGAGTRRQGTAAGAGRCRHRCCGGRRGLRRLRQLGADLHVDRAPDRRRVDRRCIRRPARGQGRRPVDGPQRIESGICHINGPTVHDEAQMPFGGVEGSGYGRFGGQAGIEAFTDLRWITLQTTPRHSPF